MTCTLCNSILNKKITPYFYKCHNCNGIVKEKKYYLSAEEEKKRYKMHNNDVNDVRYQNFTSPITNYVLNNFSKYEKGLDFGCGTGPVISNQLKRNGYYIELYDPFFAPQKKVLNQKYNYIVSCEVFEHFYNPKKEIEHLISILKNNGVLLIMTLLFNNEMNFENWFYKNDPTHVFIYTKETFEFIAKKYQLELESISDRFIILKNK